MEEKMICLRDKIGEFLCEFGEKDDRIYVIDSDLAKSTKAIEFQNKFPERFVEAGISEASAMSIAMGLASEGQIPFYVNFAIFVSGTAWTQLRQAAYANSNIKMIASYAGMDNGKDGATHHANEDLAIVRAIPNVKILVPSNKKEMKEAIEIANQSSYGLCGCVISKDYSRAMKIADRLECGGAIVNGASFYRSFEMPFGGWKHSGIGNEGVLTTLQEMSRVKTIVLKNIL